MAGQVIVADVGMTPFKKPSESEPYFAMGAAAVKEALADSGIGYEEVQQAYAGYVYGDAALRARTLYGVGMTGIPIVNINNNCSTGSTTLFLARQAVASGAVDCALALGFEQMRPGALGNIFADRPSPLQPFDDLVGEKHIPLALRYFVGAGREHM